MPTILHLYVIIAPIMVIAISLLMKLGYQNFSLKKQLTIGKCKKKTVEYYEFSEKPVELLNFQEASTTIGNFSKIFSNIRYFQIVSS